MTQTQEPIARHKTAIKRASYSVPVKCALRDELLSESDSFFDYGCGHGQDLALLKNLGIDAAGWDPVHRSDAKKKAADVVNLGYVINVIEDVRERSDTVRSAFKLANSLLVVGAQTEYAAPTNGDLKEYRDGYLTSRGTFQKYYSQTELRIFLEQIVQTDAISAAPGIFYIFKDDERKQQFLARRYHRRISVPRRRISEVLFEQHKELLEDFMASLTEYGRLPDELEFHRSGEVIDIFGSLKRAFALIRRVTDEAPWQAIATRRAEDLLVYLALSRFGKRPSFSKLPPSVQRDIKAFLGSYKKATDQADQLLFQAGNPDAIDEACRQSDVGLLVSNGLLLHKSALDYLSPLLRVYEGCARTFVGEIEEANVIKLHTVSGKVTYLSYPNFERDPHPAQRQRIKVSLRDLRAQFFDYQEWADPDLLIRKDALVHPEHECHSKFQKLTKQEEKHSLLDGLEERVSEEVWKQRLLLASLEQRGHKLAKQKSG